MSTRTESPVEQIVETVSSWPGITTGEGRYDSTTFRLEGREIGHVHPWGPVDIGYPKRIRDALVAEGLTGEHHVIPNSNATTFRVESADDVDQAVTLLRISYLYHACVLRNSTADGGVVGDVDVDSELRSLDLGDDLRSTLAEALPSG